MIEEIELSPNLFNEVYDDAFLDECRFLNLYGGAGSGKSVFAAQKILIRMMMEEGHRFLIVRKVARTLRRSVFLLMRDLIIQWGLSSLFVIRTSEMEIICIANGNSSLFAGIDDPEKLKSIQGITGIWVEEATELDETDLNQLNLRLRGAGIRNYKQIILTYNPIDDQNWLKKRFHEQSSPNATVLKTTYQDNAFLDDEYVAELQLLESIDKTFYKIYALGEWATPEHVIYTSWTTVAPEHWPDLEDRVIGIDFGFNVPTAVTEVGYRDAETGPELYWKELLYRRKMTNGDLIEELKVLFPDREVTIYADNAEPARIQEISSAGFNIFPAQKSVKAGIDFCKRFRLFISDNSENMIKELKSYKWKLDRNKQPMDEPVKFNDHACDSVRYAAFTHGSVYWASGTEMESLNLSEQIAASSIFEGYD